MKFEVDERFRDELLNAVDKYKLGRKLNLNRSENCLRITGIIESCIYEGKELQSSYWLAEALKAYLAGRCNLKF